MATDQIDPNTLLKLFDLRSKRDVQKFCRDATVGHTELARVLRLAQSGAFEPYEYLRHHSEFVPDHLLPTEQVGAILAAGVLGGEKAQRASKVARKLSQLFQDRRVFSAHLIYHPSGQLWHLIYFDQRDMEIHGRNHWKRGSHIHYSRESYVNADLKEVWTEVCGTPPKLPASEHLRCVDTRERGLVGPADSDGPPSQIVWAP
jgi:hypothetical protein